MGVKAKGFIRQIGLLRSRTRLNELDYGVGTYDTPEGVGRAYDEAARALRGENARTNFAAATPDDHDQNQKNSPLSNGTESDTRDELGFCPLKAKLSKYLQIIMARNSEKKGQLRVR